MSPDAPTRVLTRHNYRPPGVVDHSEETLLCLALAGQLVAEELTTKTRERLFTHLHWLGWTDHEIAVHTRTTGYTTARILRRLGLTENPPRTRTVSA